MSDGIGMGVLSPNPVSSGVPALPSPSLVSTTSDVSPSPPLGSSDSVPTTLSPLLSVNGSLVLTRDGTCSMDVDLLPLPSVPPVCLQCDAWARVGSKYCSNACGVAYHMARVSGEKAREVELVKRDRFDRRCAVIWSEILSCVAKKQYWSSVEEEDASLLQTVEVEMKNVLAMVERIRREQVELEVEIQTFQVPLPSATNPIHSEAAGEGEETTEETTSGEMEKGSSTASTTATTTSATAAAAAAAAERHLRGAGNLKMTHTDCPYCGVTPSGHFPALSHHLVSCFQKFESLNLLSGPKPMQPGDLIYCDHFDPKMNTYCKKLKASCYAHSGVVSVRPLPGQKPKSTTSEMMTMCGASTADNPTTGRCRALKKDCPRHFNWEHFARNQLELQLISHTQLAEGLQSELEAIKEKMIFARLSRGLKGNVVVIPGPAASHTSHTSASTMDISS